MRRHTLFPMTERYLHIDVLLVPTVNFTKYCGIVLHYYPY